MQKRPSMRRVLVPFRFDEKVHPYLDALRTVGLDPIAHVTSNGRSLDDIDGVLFTGGTDIHSAFYDEPPHPRNDEPDPGRDRVELDLLGEALRRDLPVFGICRGLQLLNVQAGGSLVQHIESGLHRFIKDNDKSIPVHEVDIEPGTLLASAIGGTHCQVNSRHHQAAARVGAGLKVSARDPADNTIEGLELPGKRFVLAVQWHPEDQINLHPEQRRLFEAFAQAIETNASAQPQSASVPETART